MRSDSEQGSVMKWIQRVRNRRLLTSAAAVTALAGALVTGTGAGPASADATSTIGFGPCYVLHSVCIPRGTFTLTTDSAGGSGSRVNYVSAGFTYVGQISNLWIDNDFKDANGNIIPGGHLQGPEKYGHFSVAAQSWSWGSSWITVPKNGWHCATLYSRLSSGAIKKWATACHQIG